MAVTSDQIQGLYIAYFNRPADFFGLQFWTDAANNNPGGVAAVANAFAASPEYTNAYAGKSTAQIIDTLYMNLFGRHAELDGIKFWGSALTDGRLNIGNIAYQIMTGAQDTDGGFQDKTAVASKITAATAFYNALDTGAEISAYNGDVANAIVKAWLATVVDQASLDAAISDSGLTTVTAAVVASGTPTVPVQTFTLTTGVNTFTGGAGDDVFNALPGDSNAPTFTALDAIDGGAGNNTLNLVQISDLNLASAAGATVKNIQTANLTSTATVKGDVSGWTGLTKLNVIEVGGNNGGSITAATTTAVSVTDSAQANGNISVVGGSNVAVTANGVTTGTITVGGNKGTVAVTTTTATGTQGQITVNGGSTVTVTESATSSVAGATVTQGAVVVNGDATTTTVNVKQAAAVAATAARAQVDTIAFSGTTVTAGDQFKVTVNGTTYTYTSVLNDTPALVAAGLAALIPGNAVVTATTPGAGNVLFLTAKTAGTAFTSSSASTAAGGVVEGSVAHPTTNVVASGLGIAAGVVQITDLNSSNTDGTKANTITTVNLDGYGASSINSNALTTLSLANSAASVNVVDNTSTPTNTTLAVTVNNLATGAALSDATIKTLKITTATKDSALAVTAGNVTALTVAGSNAVDLSGSTLGNLKTVTVTGAAGVTGDFSGSTVTAVDSSASTGAVKVAVDATKATFKGGNGVNTVTITGDASKSIAAGSGTSDVLVANASGATFTQANTGANVTGFEILRTGTSSGGTYNLNTVFSSVKSVNVAAAAAADLLFTGAAAGTALSLDAAVGKNVTFSFLTDTPADTLSLTFGKATSDGVDFTAVGTYSVDVGNVESLTINSLGSVKSGTGVNTAKVVDAVATSLKVTGAESLTLTGLAGSTVKTIDTSAVTKGAVIDLSAITVANSGVTVTAGAASVHFTDTGIAAGKTDIVTGGDGDNVLIIGNGVANSANATVTLGNGDNTVNLTGTQGKNTVTLGNGDNGVTGGAGVDIVTVGSGANSVKAGAGADVVTFAAHAGNVATIVQASGDSGANNATVTQTSELANTFDVFKGVVAGDKIDLSAFSTYATGGLVLAGTNLAAVDNAVVFVTGTYDATAGTFTYSANGADTAVTYDHTAAAGTVNAETIVLVGFHAGATTTATAGVITLA